MTNLALIGPSGVGKGTQAARLAEQLGLSHLVIGDLLRRELERHSAVGFLAERQISQGHLVDDDIVDAVVAEQLWHTAPDQGVLFDGFPRTIEQAQFLDRLFDEREGHLNGVIFLEMADDAVEHRLLGRLVCERCQAPYHVDFKPPERAGVCDVCRGKLVKRRNDIREMIRVRLRAFRRVLEPVLEFYRSTGRLQVIDGDQPLDQVASALSRAIRLLEEQQGYPDALRANDSETLSRVTPDTVAMLPADQATHPGFDLVLMGGPGSGKGTQAEQLQKHLDLIHIASGDLFRENISNNTDLGKLAKTCMDRGELVPDDVTEAMVEDRINQADAEAGFILDGFPRTLAQAHALTEIMNAAKRRINGVLYISVSDEEIMQRLTGRLICGECQNSYHVDFKPPTTVGKCDACGGSLIQRDDDNPRTVRERLKVFHSQTGPIVSYYRDAGLLVEIDGQGDLAAVTDRALSAAKRMKADADQR